MYYYRKQIVKIINMDKTQWRDYFQFTRNERTAIIILLALIVITGTAPAFLKNGATEPLPSLALYEEGINQLEEIQETTTRKYVEERENNSGQQVLSYSSSNTSLFVFDPNTLSEAGWKKLGVRGKTINTIRNYLAKGGRFRSPEDISKVYGLSEKDIKRLLPYVRITTESSKAKVLETEKSEFVRSSSGINNNYSLPKTIDINEADTSLFIQLPGIGSKLAQRIINFRDKLGGFYSVDQVGETFGLTDSVFQKFRKSLICRENTITKININSASADALKTHPYIKWNLANAIVQYRAQHGYFKTVAELEQIQLLGPGQLAKLLPYLSVE
jgi:competence protein ComEA